MRPTRKKTFLALFCISATVFGLGARRSDSPHDETLLQVDRDFQQSVSKADRTQVEGLLGKDFTWTDSQGKTETRTEFLGRLNSLSTPPATPHPQIYGDVAVVTASSGRVQAVRIWVHDQSAWRLLAA